MEVQLQPRSHFMIAFCDGTIAKLPAVREHMAYRFAKGYLVEKVSDQLDHVVCTPAAVYCCAQCVTEEPDTPPVARIFEFDSADDCFDLGHDAFVARQAGKLRDTPHPELCECCKCGLLNGLRRRPR